MNPVENERRHNVAATLRRIVADLEASQPADWRALSAEFRILADYCAEGAHPGEQSLRADLVRLANHSPFMSIGHAVEHVLDLNECHPARCQLRDGLAAVTLL